MILCKTIALRWQTISKVKMIRTKAFIRTYQLLTSPIHYYYYLDFLRVESKDRKYCIFLLRERVVKTNCRMAAYLRQSKKNQSTPWWLDTFILIHENDQWAIWIILNSGRTPRNLTSLHHCKEILENLGDPQ